MSGENVVLVAAGALTLGWLLGIGRWLGELGALAGIGAYVLAVGPQPSVIRAGVAGGLASLAWPTGRLRDAWQAPLLTAVALQAWNPYELYDPGFQLSFVARSVGGLRFAEVTSTRGLAGLLVVPLAVSYLLVGRPRLSRT